MTATQRIGIIGAPTEAGASQRGTAMGPAALRTADLIETLRALGHDVTDFGDAAHAPPPAGAMPDAGQAAGWARALSRHIREIAGDGRIPIVLGGDHSISLGSVAGMATIAAERGRELFLLWLDAHPDFNTPQTSPSGNIHGLMVAYLCGLPGFEAVLGAPLAHPVEPRNIMMLGIRSIDPPEQRLLLDHGIAVHDMRAIDEHGIVRLLAPFIATVAQRQGMQHVSFDVDFLDPEIAPGVGTTVPGGATIREAHLIMEMLHDSGLIASLDLAELNPFLDERGRTARLVTDLAASLFGRRIMDRPTRTPWSA
jgi:arginase